MVCFARLTNILSICLNPWAKISRSLEARPCEAARKYNSATAAKLFRRTSLPDYMCIFAQDKATPADCWEQVPCRAECGGSIALRRTVIGLCAAQIRHQVSIDLLAPELSGVEVWAVPPHRRQQPLPPAAQFSFLPSLALHESWAPCRCLALSERTAMVRSILRKPLK